MPVDMEYDAAHSSQRDGAGLDAQAEGGQSAKTAARHAAQLGARGLQQVRNTRSPLLRAMADSYTLTSLGACISHTLQAVPTVQKLVQPQTALLLHSDTLACHPC